MSKNDPELTVKFNLSELYQITLALASRNAFATQKWASASSQDDQNAMAAEIEYLDKLLVKVRGYLSEGQAPKGTN